MLYIQRLRRRIYLRSDGMCQQDMFLVFFIDKGDILHKQAGNLIREPVGIGTTAAAIEKGILQLFSSFQLIFFPFRSRVIFFCEDGFRAISSSTW